MNFDSTYKDLFKSFGVAVVGATLYVSVGKALTENYFIIAIVVAALTILPLAYHDYRRNHEMWFNAKQKMLQRSQRIEQFKKNHRKGASLKLSAVHREKMGRTRAHSEGYIEVKGNHKRDVRNALLVGGLMGCGVNNTNRVNEI